MSHYCLLTAALLTAVSAQAAAVGSAEVREARQLNASAYVAHASTQARANELITTAPEGETRVYGRDAVAYFQFLGTTGRATDTGCREEIVFCENGEVYFHNPVSGVNLGTYVKGQLDGQVIHVTLPQLVGYVADSYDDTDPTPAYLTRFMVEDPTATNLTGVAAAEQSVDFVLADDGSVTWNVDYEFLGLGDAEGMWLGQGSAYYYYDPFVTPEAITPPVGVARKSWALIDRSLPNLYLYTDAMPISVCLDDANSEIYISGLYKDSAGRSLWVKGSVDGEDVSIPSDQYLGFDEDYGTFMYLKGALAEETINEVFNLPQLSYTALPSLDLKLDRENMRLTPTDDAQALVVNCGRISMHGDGYLYPVMQYQNPESTALQPGSPEIGTWWPADDWYRYFELEVILPPYSTGRRPPASTSPA